MRYSRENPGPRYCELTQLYRRLHREGEQSLGLSPAETYPGVSMLPHLDRVKAMIEVTGARTLLDYGCGKGMQYEPHPFTAGGAQWEGVIDYWDIDEICCYDPCYDRYCRLPEGQFDGVVTTDVLEHCAEDDIQWIVPELFSYARRFVFASVACYAAKTTLPNGENAHCTVRPVEWWQTVFSNAAQQHEGVCWKLYVEQHEPGEHGMPAGRADA